MSAKGKKSSLSSLWVKEDWWALWIGLLLFLLSLPNYYKVYLLGFLPSGPVGAPKWVDITRAVTPTAWGIPPIIGLIAMWIFLMLILTPAAKLTGVKVSQWLAGFTVVFWAGWFFWIMSSYKPITEAIGSAEVGWVIALLVGIVIGNLPKVPVWLTASAKGEFFIKTAIVLLGAQILLTTFVTTAGSILAAVFLSFPLTWIVAFIISTKVLRMDRDMAAVLGSGVGVCGISAAIATAGAIGAPGIYATLIASVIVVYSAVELLILPFIAAYVFPHSFAAGGAWMGLSVKTDGAAAASGAVLDGLVNGKGMVLNYAVATKVMIDIWIGLIAFILAVIWVYRIKREPGTKVSPLVIWYRFPKFVIGYIFTSLVLSAIAFSYPTAAAGVAAVAPVNIFGALPLRLAFFSFTFFSIGLATRIAKFKEVGLGKPLVAYTISLLFAILWGGIIASVFFR